MNDNGPGNPDRNVIGDERVLSLEELANACRTQAQWVIELVTVGVLAPEGSEASAWRFRAVDLRCAFRTSRLQRDFGASMEAVAVMLDLLDEIERPRARLKRSGLNEDEGR
ncbi:MAG: chaperone modulator CbpM [Nitrospira sp.]